MDGASEVYKLWRLQQIDLERTKLRDQLAQPTHRAAYEEALAAARQELRKLKEAEAAQTELQKQVRRGELELATQEAKIKELEASIYGGSVTNPRELAGLQKKLASVQGARAKQEDELLAAMQELETAQATATAARRAAEQLTRRYKTEDAALKAETSQLQTELAQVEQKRQELAATIDATWLARYDKLCKQRPDVIAMVEGDSCSACRLSLPPSLINQAAQHGQPTYCESCGRLLFLP